MSDLNDKELDALFSTVSPAEPPENMSQRIMAALSTPQTPRGLRGFMASIFGDSGFAAPTSGAVASLLFGISLGYLALPDLTDISVTEDAIYLEALNDSNWDTSFEDLIQ